MKCPYCDSEMEQGYLQGPGGVFWSEKSKRFFLYPREQNGDVVIAGSWERSSGDDAWLCRNCGKMIIDVKYNII
jgi:hypothetical protein